ncbi:MAG: hypothetical protein ACOC3V_01460 [bacterium]
MLKYNQFKEAFEDKNSKLLFEGLIYSFPYSKFKEKLSNILTKYKITGFDLIQSEDGIFLINFKPIKNKKLYDDINNLLNLSGYYISSYKKDGNDVKYSSLGIVDFIESKNLNIVFNKKFDFYDSGINIFLYHVTDEKYLNKIKQIGLTPKSNKTIDNHPDRIYLFDSIDDLDLFIKNKSYYIEGYVPIKLKINVKSLPKLKLYKDPKYPNTDAYYTYDNIPPHSIEIINY